MDLDLLCDNNEFSDNECLPFEESLKKALDDCNRKTIEELEKQWHDEDEQSKNDADDYLEHIQKIKFEITNNDEEENEYSSEEDIPTCNPWRE